MLLLLNHWGMVIGELLVTETGSWGRGQLARTVQRGTTVVGSHYQATTVRRECGHCTAKYNHGMCQRIQHRHTNPNLLTLYTTR
jgi:hypothetical protein